MPAAYFVVRATVSDPGKRSAFDKWYQTEHLPDAARSFGAKKAWRFWSLSDPAVHQATYQFDDEAALDRATKGGYQTSHRGFQSRLAGCDAHARHAGAGGRVRRVIASCDN